MKAPAWISSAGLPETANDTLSACFEAGSDQAEAALSVSSTRDYAQMISVVGRVDFQKSSFEGSLGAGLADLLHSLASGSGEVLVLGPYEHATLTIDRPAPEVPTRQYSLSVARGAPSALAGRVWSLLRAAARSRVVVPDGVKRCLAAALVDAASSVPAPRGLLDRAQRCVTGTAAPGPLPDVRLRAVARALLTDRLLKRATALERREPRAGGVAFTIPYSPGGLVNPQIQISIANLGSVLDGRRTVEHLRATGGAPPYRYYTITEPGGPQIPSWVQLAPDGTLTIEPPAGSSREVSLSIEVIDSNGERSVAFA